MSDRLTDCLTPVDVGFTNPFSVSRTAAGTFPYLVTIAEAELIRARFADYVFRGVIRGPHGAGKTTLALWLADSFRNTFGHVSLITFRKNSATERVTLERTRRAKHTACELWIVDGLENLNRFQRMGFLKCLRHRGSGILATVHGTADFGLPFLTAIEPEFDVFSRLVASLQDDFPGCLAEEDVADAWNTANGNFRKAFSVLYDLYEQRAFNKDPWTQTQPRSFIHSQHCSIALSSGRNV